jgi:hypothetical protein
MTGWNRPREINHRSRSIEGELRQQVLAMWCAGRDTLDIARALCIPESDIANSLPKILEQRRYEQRWEMASA